MYKIIFFNLIFFVSVQIFGGAINKPKIRFGINSNSYLKNQILMDGIYFSTSTDSFSLSIEEKFNKMVNLKYVANISLTRYNKYAEDFSSLSKFYFKNYLYLTLALSKIHKIKFMISPRLSTDHSDKYYSSYSYIIYSATSKNIKATVQYSNQFKLKEGESVYHKLNLSVYWVFPKVKFMKFKTSVSCYMQHGLYENLDIFPLTKISAKFEVGFDFNKLSFEEIFQDISQDDDIFNE